MCLHTNNNSAQEKGTSMRLNPEEVTKCEALEDGGSELQSMNRGLCLGKKELPRVREVEMS